MDEWMQRRDEGGRMTYPPLPTKGGNPNAEAPEGAIKSAAAALARTHQQEAEFRARQYARRLKTRGRVAMQNPSPAVIEPFVEPIEPASDPDLDPYRTAGWC